MPARVIQAPAQQSQTALRENYTLFEVVMQYPFTAEKAAGKILLEVDDEALCGFLPAWRFLPLSEERSDCTPFPRTHQAAVQQHIIINV